MERRSFAEVLRSAKIDIKKEYSRLYLMFYINVHEDGFIAEPLYDICSENFREFPGRGTCISLDDFDDTYGFNFAERPKDFDINYLINFCEYAYNIALFTASDYSEFTDQILKVIEKIGYMPMKDDGFAVFVPKNPAAISVAEIVNDKLAYSVLEYNHHSMKDDLNKKLAVLKLMADDIEPQRKALAQINKAFSEQLFQMLNKFVRHAHEKTPYIQTLSDEEVESYYDDIYQMWLLAKLELDNIERRQRIDAALKVING